MVSPDLPRSVTSYVWCPPICADLCDLPDLLDHRPEQLAVALLVRRRLVADERLVLPDRDPKRTLLQFVYTFTGTLSSK